MAAIPESDKAFRLDGRVALVTGGTRGIGEAVAREFVDAGAFVILTGRQEEAAQEAAAALGGRAVGLAYDAADPDAPEALAEAVSALGRGLDIVANNAAIMKPHFVNRLNHEEVDLLYQVNVKAPLFLTKALHPLLAESPHAAVVNITAAGGHRPMAGIGAYCSTKAAFINLTVTLAKEWAKDGIRVNGLTPGSVMTDQILPKDPAQREAFIAEMASQNLFGRLAEPAEIARVARFLASDAASYLTGSILLADAGFLA